MKGKMVDSINPTFSISMNEGGPMVPPTMPDGKETSHPTGAEWEDPDND